MSSEIPPNAALDADERAELERLRAELAERRSERSEPEPRAPRGRARLRTTAAVVIIAIGCLLGPPAVVALWASGVVGDTDRYVETVAPLAEDPALQAAVTADITNEIFSRVDVDTLATRAVDALGDQLPPAVAQQLSALSGPLASGVRSATQDQIASLVESDAFAQAWTEANRAAHTALDAALSGDGAGALQVQDGTVSVDLSSFTAAVKERLSARGFALADQIPEINTQFVILQSDDLSAVQSGYSLLGELGFWLGPIAGAVIALGVYVARNHRLAFIGAGLGLAAAMLASGIALYFAREAYLDAVPPAVLPGEAAAALFDTSVRFLREVIRAMGLLGLAFAAGAFLTGPSVTATRVRGLMVRAGQATANGLDSLGLHVYDFGRTFRTRGQLWRAGAVVLAFAGFVIPTYPTPALVLWLTAALLLGLFVIQVFASARDTRVPSEEPSDATDAFIPAQTRTGADAASVGAPEPTTTGQQ